MALRLKRGTEADRALYVPIAGELIYTTDTKKLYIGDGNTSGGVLVDRGGDWDDLTNKPTIPSDISDLTDSTNLLANNTDFETVTLGRTNSQDQFIPYVITDSVQNTLQDQIPPTNVVGGLIEKVVYSKQLSRYSSGGELLLTLICNTDDNDYYTTRKFVFSRTGTDTYNVTESGAAGATEIYDSIEITERLDGTDLFLEVTVKAPDSSLPFIRVVGQITYTSVPIFLTASGY